MTLSGQSAVAVGTTATLTCTLVSSDSGYLYWYTRYGWQYSSHYNYKISTGTTNVEVDGVTTRKLTSILRITNFQSLDANSNYRCKMDSNSYYIIDEHSTRASIKVFGKSYLNNNYILFYLIKNFKFITSNGLQQCD